MNRVAAIDRSDSSPSNVALDEMAGGNRICSSQDAVHYAMWPTSAAGAQVIYALAFAAAQNRVAQLERVQRCQPAVNWASLN